MVKQEDIAKALNISRATVSRALSGGNVNEQTKKRILEKIEEMGYIPNAIASNLATKNKKRIYLFLITSVVEGYKEEMHKGIQDAIKNTLGSSFDIILQYTDINIDKDQDKLQLEAVLKTIDTEIVDMIVLSPTSLKNLIHIEKICKERKIPLFTLDMPFYDHSDLHIGSNYFEIGRISASLIAKFIRKKGTVLVIEFDEGYELNNSRIDGFKNEIATYKDIHTLYVKAATTSVNEYQNIIDTVEKEHQLDAIYATFKVEHICSIIEKNDKDIVVIGNDINAAIHHYLTNGLLYAVVYQRPYYQGFIIMKHIYKYFYHNIDFQKGIIHTGCDIIIKENLDILENYY